MLMNIFAVACGGACGATLRYLTGVMVQSHPGQFALFGSFPIATFIANVCGCFLIGVLSVFFEGASFAGKDAWKLFAITGIMGGFTTFSTFSLETVTLAQEGAWGLACLNAGLSLAFCLAGVVLGRMAAVALLPGK